MAKENSNRGPDRLRRVAQYLRMSTDHQRYSLENQSAKISAYAADHDFEIVETYTDPGRSGLTLEGRPALKKLLSDVLKDPPPFEAILVLDVSRWGRFQDPDQAAHYEFVCRSAGIDVIYCAEAFDNQDKVAVAVLKHLKRIMAGEYSRELSEKVHFAQLRQAQLGYKQGGSTPYGVRRLLIDKAGIPQAILEAGQYKVTTDHRVVPVRGPAKETKIIREIFRMFVGQECSTSDISQRLNEHSTTASAGKPWTASKVRSVLTSESALGRYVFNRTSNRLRGPTKKNPPESWVRVDVMAPIVSEKLFYAAAERLARGPRYRLNREEMLVALRQLYRSHGHVSGEVLQATAWAPAASSYRRRFGGLKNAMDLAGVPRRRRWAGQSGRPATDKELLQLLRDLKARHGRVTGRIINEDPVAPCSRVYGARFGSLRQAYHLAGLPHTLSEIHRAPYKDGATQDVLPKWEQGASAQMPFDFSDDDLIQGLVRLHGELGYINSRLIDRDPRLPSVPLFIRRFGSLKLAYEKAGLPHDIKTLYALAAERRWGPRSTKI